MADRTHNREYYVRQAGPYADFIRELVVAGRYESVEEAILAGLDLLQSEELARKAKADFLRDKIQAGIDDADAGRVRPADEVFDRLTRKYSAASG